MGTTLVIAVKVDVRRKYFAKRSSQSGSMCVLKLSMWNVCLFFFLVKAMGASVGMGTAYVEMRWGGDSVTGVGLGRVCKFLLVF